MRKEMKMRKFFSIIIVIGLLVLVYGGIGFAKTAEVKKAVIILIDRTDGITKEQRARFFHEITFLKDQLNENDQLIIYEVPGAYKEKLEKYQSLFSATIPINPDNCDDTWKTCSGPNSEIEKKYKLFQKSFSDIFANMQFDKNSNNSYILEAIRMIVTTKEFKSFPSKKFILFSNLLQNSTSISHYRKYASISTLKESYLFSINDVFVNTDVYVYMLPDGRYQTTKLIKWWWAYFNIGKPKSLKIQIF
jgi:hypothetical protein